MKGQGVGAAASSSSSSGIGTAVYFREELGRFWKLCGEESFWFGPKERRDAVLVGIGHLFATAEGLTEGDAISFEAAMLNYTHRAALLEIAARRRLVELGGQD